MIHEKRPTRSFALPIPFAWTSLELRSRRAFSIPPHARMYWRAWTSMVFPSGPATDRPLHEAPFDSSRTAVTVAFSTAVIFLDASTSGRYFLPKQVGGLNWKYAVENSSPFQDRGCCLRSFAHRSTSNRSLSSSHISDAAA